MGLFVESIALYNWRNFVYQKIAPSPQVTVLVGPNAVGKTNIIEALQLLTVGISFRHPAPNELIRIGESSARAQARLLGDGRIVDTQVDVVCGKRSFSRNGKTCHASDMSNTLMSVLFDPDDLSFIKRGATQRRGEIDTFGKEVSASFGKVLAAYQRIVEQRNRLLRESSPDSSVLDAWDSSLARGGAALLSARLKLYLRLMDKMKSIYYEISDGEKIEGIYRSGLGDVIGASRQELELRLASALFDTRGDDLRRQQTSVGPHRDDLSFLIEGRDARIFGSQGQQRTVVLAWKMAEVEVASDVVGQRPLLLLDDVMSELDENRRCAVVSFVKTGIQTVVTTTNLGYFTDEFLRGAKVVNFGDGKA